MRSFAANIHLSEILHYCLPTLILGGFFRLRHSLKLRRNPQVQPPRSVIVFRLDRIGDIVLSSAMLRELRAQFPNAHITIVVNTDTQPLVEHCPYVNTVLAKPGNSGSLASVFTELRMTLAFCKRYLAGRTWDLAIVPRWDTDRYFATLMCSYTGATERLAFSEHTSQAKRRLNWGFDALYSTVLGPGPLMHEAERNLEMIRYLGRTIAKSELELWLTPADEAYPARCRHDFGLTESSDVIAFGVGASQAKTRWPAARFAELINHLRASDDFTPAIICGPDEIPIVREIQARTTAKLLMLTCPSIRQTAAFISRCILFIGNDSGPIHIAVAAGLPVVEISCHPTNGDPEGDNSPESFGPFTNRCAIVRPPRPRPPCVRSCTRAEPHCITEVSVAQVARAAHRLLGARPLGHSEMFKISLS